MSQGARKPKTSNTAQDIAGADQRISARLRELAERRAAIDRDLLTVAAQKRAARTAPTVREAKALSKYEHIREEEQFWRTCRRLPQRHLRVLSGRHPRQFLDQSQRYGLSIGGKTWDLAAVMLELFALLAEIAPWYRQWEGLPRDDAALLVGPNTAAMERVRIARARLLELELQQRTREVLPQREVREGFNELAGFLRAAGERIGREHGPAAGQILEDALKQGERMATKVCRPGEKLPADKGPGPGQAAQAGK